MTPAMKDIVQRQESRQPESPADEKRKRNAESGKQDTQATDLPISYDDESEKESRKSQSSRKSSDSEDRHKKSSHKTDKSREERFKFVCF